MPRSRQEIQRLSPLLWPLPNQAPPLLMSYGGDETSEFQRQSEDMLERWRSHGLRAELFAQPNRNHFTAMTDLMDPDAPLTQQIARFMNA